MKPHVQVILRVAYLVATWSVRLYQGGMSRCSTTSENIVEYTITINDLPLLTVNYSIMMCVTHTQYYE